MASQAAAPAEDVSHRAIEQLNWDNSSVRDLKLDTYPNPSLQRTVRGANFSVVSIPKLKMRDIRVVSMCYHN